MSPPPNTQIGLNLLFPPAASPVATRDRSVKTGHEPPSLESTLDFRQPPELNSKFGLRARRCSWRRLGCERLAFHCRTTSASTVPCTSRRMCYPTPCASYHFTEMCCGNEAGSYVRLIDSCITQLKAQGPSATCNESKKTIRISYLLYVGSYLLYVGQQIYCRTHRASHNIARLCLLVLGPSSVYTGRCDW